MPSEKSSAGSNTEIQNASIQVEPPAKKESSDGFMTMRS